MKYLLLIYEDEKREASEAEMGQIFQSYAAYDKDVKDKNLWLGGNALQPTSTATAVRVRGGKVLTTDGPFAETKEQLGGFYMLDCKDLDEALEYAAKIPSAEHGTIEVRPIMEFEM